MINHARLLHWNPRWKIKIWIWYNLGPLKAIIFLYSVRFSIQCGAILHPISSDFVLAANETHVSIAICQTNVSEVLSSLLRWKRLWIYFQQRLWQRLKVHVNPLVKNSRSQFVFSTSKICLSLSTFLGRFEYILMLNIVLAQTWTETPVRCCDSCNWALTFNLYISAELEIWHCGYLTHHTQ